MFKTLRLLLIAVTAGSAASLQAAPRQSSTVAVTPTGLSIPESGGLSLITDNPTDKVSAGYARLSPQTSATTPAGTAIIAMRVNGTLVSEVGVPASPMRQSGRVYTEVDGNVQTGVAIVNPNDQAANVSFSFTDANGSDYGAGTLTVPPHGQLSQFLNQAPINGGSVIHGSFSFTSDAPVSVIAIRGFVNERSEFLMTTSPVVDTISTNAAAVALPYFVDGGGWKTEIPLVNGTDLTISGTLQFVDPFGKALYSLPYSIPRRSSVKLQTPGTGASVQSGSIQIVPGSGLTPAAIAIFSLKISGITVSEAAVSSVSSTALRMYVTASGSPGATGAKQTGIALVNLSPSPAAVTFKVTSLGGSNLTSTTLTLPGNGQSASYLSDIFGTQMPASPFQGILRISAASPGISVVGLLGQYNERGELLISTTPPTDETLSASTADSIFPQVVSGSGFTTQFLVFSGSAGQSTHADLLFLNQDGTSQTSPVYPVCDGATVSSPLIFRRVEPSYTDAARQAKIQGTVLMSSTINADGTITITGFLQTLGYGLDESAQSALEKWRFCPAIRNGQPTAINVTIQVNFSLL
jgi:TonB family protein